jgi:hypothetical protein
MALQQYRTKRGDTLSYIGGGRIQFSKGGPHRDIELRLWERDPTETTNSTLGIDVVKDDVIIGKIALSREGIAELLGAHRRHDESIYKKEEVE